MAEFIKVYRQSMPAVRFIGKKYGRPGYDHWVSWFENGWFAAIETAAGGEQIVHELYEDGNAYIGMLRYKEGEPIEYWVGVFTPIETIVPEGFLFIDIPASDLGVCWIYGPINEIFGLDFDCYVKVTEAGMQIESDKCGAIWSFERRGCSRMTEPDEKGNFILDYCYFVKEK